ncbi:hypothetical protein [Paenibacillus tundrae]
MKYAWGRDELLYIVTAEQMRSIDEHTIHTLGIPAASLMENAGRAIAEEVIRLCREEQVHGRAGRMDESKRGQTRAHTGRGLAWTRWRHHRRFGAGDGATR